MMKVGDLVKQYIFYADDIVKDVTYGIIVDIPQNSPNSCGILNKSGKIEYAWKKELEVINEGG